MKRFLALGLSAGLLAVAFSALNMAPAEACRQFNQQDRRAQARAIRRYERQLAMQRYQNQFPPGTYAGGQYPYPMNQYPYSVDYAGYYPPAASDYASYYPPAAVDYASYPPAGYSPYFPGTGLNAGLNAGLNGGLGNGLVQGLLSLF